MTTSKYLLAAVLLVAVILAIGYTMSPKTAIGPSELKNWQTYTNDDFNFSIQYPDLFTAAEGDASDYPVGSSLVTNDGRQGFAPVIASIIMNEADYQNTNLAGAWITVSTTTDTDAEQCQTIYYGDGILALTESVDIGDITWNTRPEGWMAEAAAGTTFESRIYNTYHQNICYQLALHLATTNIGNYDLGTVREVDENALRAQLQSVAQTFQVTI